MAVATTVVVVTTTVATRPRTAAAEATMVATTRTRTAAAAAATTVAAAQTVADTVSATETPPRHHDVDNYHTSATCSHPGENHQRTATHTNTRGGSMHGMHKTILPSATGRQAPPPCPSPSTRQLHSHLLPSFWQQRPAFAHDSRQLGLWTPRRSIPASQQCAPFPTWYCNDAKHNGLRQPVPAGAPVHSRTAGPTQLRVVQQLLTGRGGR